MWVWGGGGGDTYILYTYYNIVRATHFHKLRGGSSGWYKMKVFLALSSSSLL